MSILEETAEKEVLKKDVVKNKKNNLFKKILFILLFIFSLVTIGAAYLYFFFPKDKAKKLIIGQLKKNFHITLKFSGLDFNPFRGLELSGVSLKGPQDTEIPMVKLDRILFKMEFWDLFRGKITIKKASIENPFIFLERRGEKWNFKALVESFHGKKQSKAVSPTPSHSSFMLPVEVHLEEFSTTGLGISCSYEDKATVVFKDIDITCRLELGKEFSSVSLKVSANPDEYNNLEFAINNSKKVKFLSNSYLDLSIETPELNKLVLSGKWSVGKGSIYFDGKKESFQISSSLYSTIDLSTGHVDLKSLDISSENIVWFKVNGTAENIFASPSFALNMNGSSVLGSGFRKFKAILPFDKAAGSILLSNVSLKGEMPQRNSEGVKRPPLFSLKGKFSASDIVLESKKEDIKISGFNFNVDLSNLTFEDDFKYIDASIDGKSDYIKLGNVFGKKGLDLRGLEEAGKIKLNNESISGNFTVTSKNCDFEPFGAKGANCNFSFKLLADKKLETKTIFSFDNLEYLHSGLGAVSFPLKLESSFNVDVKPDFEIADYGLLDISDVSGYVDIGALKAELKGSQSDKEGLSASISVKSELEKLSSLIPPKVLEKIGAVNTGGKLLSETKITGKLIKGLEKSPLKIVENLQITAFSLDCPKKISMEPSELYLHMTSDYRVGTENVSIDLGGDISLGSSRTADMALDFLQASFQAKSIDKKTLDFESRINGNMIGFALLMPNFSTSPTNLSFGIKSKQNLKNGSVNFETVRLGIPSILDFKAKGMVKDWGKYFGSDLKLTVKSLEKLYSILSDDIKKEIPVFGGKADFSLQLAGKRPESPSEALPVILDAKLNLSDVSGGVGKVEARGVTTNFEVSYHPQQASLFNAKSLSPRPTEKKSVFLRSLKFEDNILNDIHLNFELENNVMTLSDVNLSFLEGSVKGKFLFKEKDANIEPDVELEFSNLNLNKLPGIPIKGDPKIAGLLKLEGSGGEQKPPNMEMTINHISGETLERLLLFLDPAGSRASVINARSYLKYAIPSKVEIKFLDGKLSVYLNLKAKKSAGRNFVLRIFQEVPASQLENFNIFKEKLELIKLNSFLRKALILKQ